MRLDSLKFWLVVTVESEEDLYSIGTNGFNSYFYFSWYFCKNTDIGAMLATENRF